MSFINRPLFTLGFLVAAALLAYLWVWPQYQEFAKASAQVRSRQATLESREAYLAEIRETQKKLEEHDQKLSQVHAALPDELSLPLLYSKMQSLSAESGGVLGSVSADQSSEEGSSLKAISVSFSFEGSYEDMKKFVERIHASSRFLEVTSIQFASGGGAEESEDSGTFEFQVTAKAYSY